MAQQQANLDLPLFHNYNPFELMSTMQSIFDTSQKLAKHFADKHPEKLKSGQLFNPNIDPFNLSDSFQALAFQMMNEPTKVFEAQLGFWADYGKLWQNTAFKMLGQNVDPFIQPEKGDRRFKDEAWSNYLLFDFIKQSYLLTARSLYDTVTSLEFDEKDERHAKKVEFYTRQLIDALSPSNFAATNPEVLHVTVRSGGKSLLNGLQNFLQDLERGQGKLNIKMTDLDAFHPGENIAVSEGSVVFQNDLMQLIQYTPSTEQVFKKPLLIVPPWINKFYILDLRPNNSYIKWAVDQGHTVFVISWINPDESLAHKCFSDYMLEGPLAALDAIEQATGEKEVNAAGYCLGGTLLATTLAYMSKKKDNRISSATFFTTMLDFTDAGELDIFIDDEQITSLEKKMDENGYLDGSEMATTFTMLRANDLVWSFHINNYLKGNEASAFDLLYWNSDSTRMPAKMHSFYLRNLYQKNLLKDPNGIQMDGVDINLRDVKTPVYFISAVEDHIAPWKSTYAGTQLFSGPVKFVLGGSGHIAGIVNPPAKNKYFYLTNAKTKTTKNPETWEKSAKRHEGSWWNDWQQWVGTYAGDSVDARTPGAGKLPALEAAPGSYVKIRITPS